MTSIARVVRDWMRGIPKDAPLDYTQITDELYIGAWPTKYNNRSDELIDSVTIAHTLEADEP